MSDCRLHCSYCGMAPCVGDRCPQWDDEDDWDDLADDYEPFDEDDDYEDGTRDGPCVWCGDVLYPGDRGGVCDRCAWQLGQAQDD